MIVFLRESDGVLQEVQDPGQGIWIKVTAPTPDEIQRLKADFGILPDFIAHALDVDERARVEREEGATLVVLRLPHLNGRMASTPYNTIPVGVIIKDDCLITICAYDGHVIKALASGNSKKLLAASPSRFLLQLLDVMAEGYLNYVRDINKAVDELENRLQRSQRNEEVLELLKYQKSLTYFTTGIKSNMLMLERLKETGMFAKSPEDDDMLSDVGIELQQASEMIDISENILSQMMDAFASIISNNINAVMKFLASMTIVLTVPMLVASIYGMNVRLPGEDHPLALVMIIGVAFTVSVVVAVVFKKKDWF
jgi:magnesium transporter